jgi:hypothetical protein
MTLSFFDRKSGALAPQTGERERQLVQDLEVLAHVFEAPVEGVRVSHR